MGEVSDLRRPNEISLAQMQEMVGELNFAQTAVICRLGRVAVRPLFDFVPRGGAKVGPQTGWALDWHLQVLLLV